MTHRRMFWACWLVAVLLLSGCAWVRSPVKKLDEAQAVQAGAKTDLLKEGQEYAAAAGKAIGKEAQPSREAQAAGLLLSRANRVFDLALGPILPERDSFLEKLVADLISENAQLREQGARSLAAKDHQAEQAAQALAAADAKVLELTAKVSQYAADRDAVARKWERLMRWVWGIVGAWVFVAIVLPLVGKAFPAVGAVTTAAQAIVAPFASAALSKTKQVLSDVVSGVEEMRTTLKKTGTISKQEADATLSQWVTEGDGTAAAVDAVRRENGLLTS